MSFKRKLEIHDQMMAIHRQFMKEVSTISIDRKLQTSLETLFKAVCLLVDEALAVDERKLPLEALREANKRFKK